MYLDCNTTEFNIFMGRLAHEMNNRLNMILMNIDCALMEKGSSNGNSQNCLETIRDQSSIMSHIVDAMQVLTSISDHEPKPLDLNHIITRSIEMVKFLHVSKSNTFVTKLAPARTIVFADMIYLEKCFLFLLEGALLSAPKGDQITIATQEHENGSKVGITIAYNNSNVIKRRQQCLPYAGFSTKNDDAFHQQLGFGLVQKIIAHFGGIVMVEKCKNDAIAVTISLPCFNQKNTLENPTSLPNIRPIEQEIVYSSRIEGIG